MQTQNEDKLSYLSDPKYWTIGKVMTANLAMAGLQLCFACYCVMNTPFLKEMRISDTLNPLVMALGPICGFFVQPIVGYCSDLSSNRFGKRRPFVLAGAIATALSQCWTGFSCVVSGWFYNKGTETYFTFSQVWAVIGVALFNTFVNMEMGSFRSLLADVIPPESQNRGATFSGFMIGGAFVVANIIILALYYVNNQNISYTEIYPIMGSVAAICTIVLVFPTLILVKEREPKKIKVERSNIFKQLYGEFKGMNSVFYRVMAPTLCGWLAFFPVQSYLGTFFAMDVTVMGQIATNLVATVFSPVLPFFIDKFGERLVFIICSIIFILGAIELVTGAFMPLESGWNSTPLVVLAIGLGGFLSASLNSVPFALVGKLAPSKSKGLYSGIFNCVVVIGQEVATLLIMLFNAIILHNSTENWIPLMVALIGGCLTFATSFLVRNAYEVPSEESLIKEEILDQQDQS